MKEYEQTVWGCKIENVANIGSSVVGLVDDQLSAVHLSVDQLI